MKDDFQSSGLMASIASIEAGTLYTPEELARFFKLKGGTETLQIWRTTGRYPLLRFRKIGGLVRYLGADILAFLDAKPRRAAPYTPKNPRAPSPRRARPEDAAARPRQPKRRKG